MGILAKLEAVSSNNARIVNLWRKGEVTFREALSGIEVGMHTSPHHWTVHKLRMEHSDAGLRSEADVRPSTDPLKTIVQFIMDKDPNGFQEGKYWF